MKSKKYIQNHYIVRENDEEIEGLESEGPALFGRTIGALAGAPVGLVGGQLAGALGGGVIGSLGGADNAMRGAGLGTIVGGLGGLAYGVYKGGQMGANAQLSKVRQRNEIAKLKHEEKLAKLKLLDDLKKVMDAKAQETANEEELSQEELEQLMLTNDAKIVGESKAYINKYYRLKEIGTVGGAVAGGLVGGPIGAVAGGLAGRQLKKNKQQIQNLENNQPAPQQNQVAEGVLTGVGDGIKASAKKAMGVQDTSALNPEALKRYKANKDNTLDVRKLKNKRMK